MFTAIRIVLAGIILFCPGSISTIELSGRPEAPNSPHYIHKDKNEVYVQPATPAGDNGHLLRVDFEETGKIISIDYDCHGTACGWTHGCDAAQCQGHSIPFEYHTDNTATWWGWSNSGENAELVFAVHHE